MSTYSSILAWRILWTEEPGKIQSMGSQRVRHAWATNTGAQDPQLLKPESPRAHPLQQEKPAQWEARAPQLGSSPHLPQLEKSPSSNEEPAQPKINKNYFKKIGYKWLVSSPSPPSPFPLPSPLCLPSFLLLLFHLFLLLSPPRKVNNDIMRSPVKGPHVAWNYFLWPAACEGLRLPTATRVGLAADTFTAQAWDDCSLWRHPEPGDSVELHPDSWFTETVR